MFIFSRSEVAPGEYECWGYFVEPWGLKAYVTWMTVAVFLLPALIITICQVILFSLALILLHSSQGARGPMLEATLSSTGACGMNKILYCFHEGSIWQAMFNIPLRTAVGVI